MSDSFLKACHFKIHVLLILKVILPLLQISGRTLYTDNALQILIVNQQSKHSLVINILMSVSHASVLQLGITNFFITFST